MLHLACLMDRDSQQGYDRERAFASAGNDSDVILFGTVLWPILQILILSDIPFYLCLSIFWWLHSDTANHRIIESQNGLG